VLSDGQWLVHAGCSCSKGPPDLQVLQVYCGGSHGDTEQRAQVPCMGSPPLRADTSRDLEAARIWRHRGFGGLGDGSENRLRRSQILEEATTSSKPPNPGCFQILRPAGLRMSKLGHSEDSAEWPVAALWHFLTVPAGARCVRIKTVQAIACEIAS